MKTFTFEEYARELRQGDTRVVDQAVAVIRKTVKLAGPRAVQAEIEAISGRRPVDRGTYRRSFRFEDITGGAVAYNFSPYASIIERGRRPGGKMPPVDLIAEWVRRKRIGVQYGPVGVRQSLRGPGRFTSGVGKGKQGPSQQIARSGPRRLIVSARKASRLSEKQARGIAFVIARAIARRGLPAHMIVARASEVIDEKVREALAKELG